MVHDDLEADELFLTVRTANCLKNAGFKTVSDVRRCGPEGLMRLPNFGCKSLLDLVQAGVFDLSNQTVAEISAQNPKRQNYPRPNPTWQRNRDIYSAARNRGRTYREIADQYGLSPARIQQIVAREDRRRNGVARKPVGHVWVSHGCT